MASYDDLVTADGAISAWDFADTSGNALDRIGSNHLTFTGTPVRQRPGFIKGDPDGAMNLNGVYATGSQISTPTTAITLEGWFYGTAPPSDGALLGQSNGTQGALLYLSSNFSGTIYFYINATEIHVTRPTLWTDGRKHHVVGTWDGSNSRIYIDGTLAVGPTAVTGPITWPAIPFQVGAYNNSLGSHDLQDVGKLAYYPTALSNAQQLAHYQAGATKDVAFVCGFEDNVTAVGATNSPAEPHWNSYVNTPGIQTSVVRTGLRAARFNPTATTQYFGRDISAVSHRGIVSRFYFRFASFPIATSSFLSLVNSSGSINIRCNNSGQLYGDVGAGSDTAFDSPISLNTWYRLDLSADSYGADTILKVSLDGGTVATIQTTQAGADFTDVRLGFTATATADLYVDDFMYGFTLADFPFGAGAVHGLVPTVDGVHSFTAGDFGYDAAGGDVGLTDKLAHTWLDEHDLSNISDFIRQKVVRSDGYVGVGGFSPIVLNDDFTRTLSDQWGTPDFGNAGGVWSDGGAPFDVTSGNNGIATVSINANDGLSAVATSVSIRDLDMLWRFKLDRLPTNANVLAWFVFRWSGGGNYYAAQVNFNGDSTALDVALKSVVGGVDSYIGSSVVITDREPARADTWFYARVRATGDGTTSRLRFKVWRDDHPEPPGWDVVQTDTTSALQPAGGAGMVLFTGDISNGPVLASFDYVRVSDPIPLYDPDALAVALGMHASGTTANTVGWKLVDSGGVIAINDAGSGGDGLTDISNTGVTNIYRNHLEKPAGGYWTLQALRELEVRFGYSTNVASLPYWDAVVVEADFPDTVTEGTRVTEAGDTRVDEAGNVRVTEEFVASTGPQTVTLGLLTQTAATFTPTVTSLATVSVGLITQTASTFTPTVTSVRNLTIALLSQTAATFTPTVTSLATISVGLIDRTAVTFTPTVTSVRNLTIALLSNTAATFAPTVTPGAAPVSVGLINQTAATFTPTVTTTYSISVGIITQTAATFTPTVTSVRNLTIALLNQTAATFNPTITTGAVNVSLGLINQTAATFTPTVTSVRNLTIALLSNPASTFTPTVGRAFSVALINQTAATFTPTVTSLATISVGLINQTATATAPTITTGAVSASVGLINQTAATFTPTVTSLATISVGLINRTATASTPTVTTANTISVALINQTATPFAPTITTGVVNVSLGLINQTATASAPTITTANSISVALINRTATASTPTITTANAISVGLINQTAATFAPTITTGAVTASVGIINQTAATFTPTVTTGVVNVSLGLINQTATASAPSVSLTLYVNLIDRTASAFAPTVSTTASISVNRIDQTAATFAPSLSLTVYVPLINQTAQTFAPSSTQQQFVTVGRINQTADTYTPSVTSLATISVALIDQTAVAYAPTVTSVAYVTVALIDQTAVAYEPSVTSAGTVALDFLDQTAVAYAPTVEAFGTTQDVSLDLIDQTAQTFAPTIAATYTIDLARINQPATTFAPSTAAQTNVFLDRIEAQAQAFAPTITTGQVAVLLPLIDRTAVAHAPSVSATYAITVGRIDQTGVAYGPTITTQNAVSVGRIDRTAQAFTPTVTVPTTQDIELPTINRIAFAFTPLVAFPSRGDGAEIIIVTGGPTEPGRTARTTPSRAPRPAPVLQTLGLATIVVNPHTFEPEVERSDDEVLVGLSDDDLVLMT